MPYYSVTRDGRKYQPSRIHQMAFVFVLDRLTESLFPVEERPVPKSEVPGEKPEPTQPFRLKPPPLVLRQDFAEQDINGRHAGIAQILCWLFRSMRGGNAYSLHTIWTLL